DPIATIGRISARLELFPLLSGEIKIIEMEVERPTARARIGEDGRMEWLSDRQISTDGTLRRIVLEQLTVTDGSLVIEDGRRSEAYEISGINALVDARALTGPWRFDGGAVIGEVP